MSRRDAIRLLGLGGLTSLLGACVSGAPRSGGINDPAPIYPPTVYPSPRVQQAAYPPPRPVYVPPAPPTPRPAPVPRGIAVVPRSAWNSSRPGRNLNAMNGVSRVTVHHMGGDAIWATDSPTCFATLNSILNGHRQRGWADIGYHYIVDRAGRVIEGRPVQYQGAHVSENNEHNLGIMLLGNFDHQSPSAAQVNAAHAFLRQVMAQYRVPASRLYTHRELKPTACPGRSLQSHMIAARNQRAFG